MQGVLMEKRGGSRFETMFSHQPYEQLIKAYKKALRELAGDPENAGSYVCLRDTEVNRPIRMARVRPDGTVYEYVSPHYAAVAIAICPRLPMKIEKPAKRDDTGYFYTYTTPYYGG